MASAAAAAGDDAEYHRWARSYRALEKKIKHLLRIDANNDEEQNAVFVKIRELRALQANMQRARRSHWRRFIEEDDAGATDTSDADTAELEFDSSDDDDMPPAAAGVGAASAAGAASSGLAGTKRRYNGRGLAGSGPIKSLTSAQIARQESAAMDAMTRGYGPGWMKDSSAKPLYNALREAQGAHKGALTGGALTSWKKETIAMLKHHRKGGSLLDWVLPKREKPKPSFDVDDFLKRTAKGVKAFAGGHMCPHCKGSGFWGDIVKHGIGFVKSLWSKKADSSSGPSSGPSGRPSSAPPPPSQPKTVPARYYADLGLPPSASISEVKAAYRKLALKHHPDKGGDPEEFKRINNAHVAITGSGMAICPHCSGAGLMSGAGLSRPGVSSRVRGGAPLKGGGGDGHLEYPGGAVSGEDRLGVAAALPYAPPQTEREFRGNDMVNSFQQQCVAARQRDPTILNVFGQPRAVPGYRKSRAVYEPGGGLNMTGVRADSNPLVATCASAAPDDPPELQHTVIYNIGGAEGALEPLGVPPTRSAW